MTTKTQHSPDAYPYRATFAKLRSGDWGARITGDAPAVGAVAVILRRAGGAVPKRLAKLVHEGIDADGVRFALYEIEDPGPDAPAAPPAPVDHAPNVAGVDAWTRGALASLRSRAERAEEHAAALAARLTALEALVTDLRAVVRAAVEGAAAVEASEPAPAPAPAPPEGDAPAVPSLADMLDDAAAPVDVDDAPAAPAPKAPTPPRRRKGGRKASKPRDAGGLLGDLF